MKKRWLKNKEGKKCIKRKEPSTLKKKTTDKAEEEEENYSNSEDEEELKKVTKGKVEKEGNKKPSKQLKYPTCNTRSSPKPLFDAMSGLSDERKRCLKQMGFKRYIQFPIVELPLKLAYNVIEKFHSLNMELRLQKGSIKETRQKVNDILGIPMGNRKLQDLDKRPDNDPFIAEWEAQYNHLGKPTPRAIALQIPAIRSWNTPMMRKRIMMETSKGCLGNLEHHEYFDPDEDQNGIDSMFTFNH
ncbi:hypothetical protein Tco_0927812 [Tanacetum coccineum]